MTHLSNGSLMNSRVTMIERIKQLRWIAVGAVVINLIVFSYSLFQFPIGNHDWQRMYGISAGDQLFAGRWFASALLVLTGYEQLPILGLLLALLLQVLSGLAAVLYLEMAGGVRFSRLQYIIGALFISLIPYVTSHHYYTFVAYVYPAAQLLVIGGLIVAATSRSILAVCAAAALVMSGFATYQPAINTAAVLVFGALIIQLARVDTAENIVKALKDLLVFLTVILLGGILYKVSLSVLDGLGFLSQNAYQLEQLSLRQLPMRFLEVAMSIARQLLVSQPYFPAALKILAFGLIVVGGVYAGWAFIRAAHPKTVYKLGLILIVGTLLFLSSKAQFFLSGQGNYYYYRFATFGIAYVYLVFFLLIPLGQAPLVKRVAIVGTCLLLYGFVVQDLKAQRDLVKQNEYDMRFINRVIARLESIEGFSYEKEYRLIQVGDFLNVKKLHGGYERFGYRSPYHDFTSLAKWEPSAIYEKMEPLLQISRSYDFRALDRYSDEEALADINKAIAFIESAPVWPHLGAVRLLDDEIIVIMVGRDDIVLRQIRDWKQRHH